MKKEFEFLEAKVSPYFMTSVQSWKPILWSSFDLRPLDSTVL
jgi:hypothetical protein